MFLIWNWRPIYCLIHGPKSQETPRLRFARRVASFVVGLVMGYLIWKMVVLNFRLVLHSLNPVLLAILIVVTGSAFALDLCIRTMVVLCFVGLAGQAGKTYLRAMAFALIIAGPIDNLVANAGEVARVFVCTTVLTYNLTKTRFDLMAKPFTNTLKGMDRDVVEIRQSFDELHGVLDDVKYAVEQTDIADENQAEGTLYQSWAKKTHNLSLSEPELPTAGEVQERFQRNMKTRCKHQLDSGHRVCQQVFREGYRKCTTNFKSWIAKAICWPYRVDIICELDLFGNPDKICDPSQVVPRNFGETYVELLRSEQELFDNSSEISVSYELRDEELAKSHLKSAERTTQAFTEEFERRRRAFLRIMGVLEVILCLFMLRLPYASMRYYLKYLGDVEFDNVYITRYFKHVDRRRRLKARETLLPLRTYEKAKYVDLDRLQTRTSQETNLVVSSLLLLLLEMFTAAIFILFDRIVVDLLQIIRQRSMIQYHQEGEHEVRFNITGVGKMAHLLRLTMHNFNIHEHVSTSLSNEQCLPNAHVLPWSFYYWLLLLYLAILVLICQSHTFLRLRRVTCGYFYCKREKQRILFLYNRIMRQRQRALQNLVEEVEGNMANYRLSRALNPLLRLRFACPRAFGWLRHCPCGKLCCLICNDPEVSSFVLCPACGLPYCDSCADEMNNICINCAAILTRQPRPKSNTSLNADDDTSIDVYVRRKKK